MEVAKMTKFDPQQQAILDCSDQHQLVSAGAGSGKTTVMIQKIVDLLLNNQAKPDELLVVTFTNLASMEMRDRLTQKLTEALVATRDENEKIRIQTLLDEIQTAAVSTIDGFCSKMLKKYFYKSSLDPEIKIISSFSQEYYINKALEQAIKQYNQTNEEDLIVLCDIFEKNKRNLDELKKSLLKAFNYCICQKDYDKFLNSILSQYTDFNTPSAKYVNTHICNKICYHANTILRLLPMLSDFPNLHKMMDSFCTHLLQVDKNDLSKTISILNTCEMYNFRKSETIVDNYDYEQLKIHAEAIKSFIKEVEFLNNLTDELIPSISHHLTSFMDLLKLFVQTYSSLKQDNNVMDFSDLERKMLDILKNKEILNEFHSSYKYIFVDEYQDINPMQDELINTLLADSSNLFLVGDVKQSIYGFRQSTPELFVETYKNYKKNTNLGSAFDMKINFRSAPEILEFNNEIFCHLMTEKDAGIDYAGSSQFEPRNKDYPTTRAVEIYAINSDIKPEQTIASGTYSVNNHINLSSLTTCHDYEINLVVNKIKELINTDVFDAKTKTNRPLQYSDIAILSRGIVGSSIQKLAKTLQMHNIPINISKSTKIKNSEALNKILAILRILNNTASDIDYTYLFTSPLVKLNYADIINIYADHSLSLYDNMCQYIQNNNDELAIKLKYGFNLCEEFKIVYSSMNTVELIDTILNRYHLRQHLIASDKGYEQLNILDEFLSTLSNEDKNLPLAKFIDLIEKNLNSKNEIITRDSLNSVTIQTIHASKGLEYPVVILFDCGNQFQYMRDRDELNFDLELGIGMQYYNLDSRMRLESPTRYAIKLKNREKAYKEELRLLYVATTRAKNKLIITGCCSKDKLYNNNLSSDNFINLILSAYYGKINTNTINTDYRFANCNISLIDSVDIDNVSSINSSNTLCDDDIIKQNIAFTYPYMAETNISIKNNVTAISRTLNDEYNIAPIKLNLSENLNATTDDLAQIGTMYHNVLSNIDFSSPYTYQNQNDDIDESLIKLAHTKISPLAKNCIKQYNEKQFMMYIPYNEIYKDSNVTTKILVQGVIDLILEFDDHVVLIDYKYSNSNIKNLRTRYNTQLYLYQLAIERALHKPVTQSYIYSIKSADLG